MPELNSKSQFQRFREDVYNSFEHRADTAMELLDALSSNQSARSVVELSLNPWFRREYSALYKAIEECFSPVSSAVTDKLSEEDKTGLLSVIAQPLPHLRLICTPLLCQYLTHPHQRQRADRNANQQPLHRTHLSTKATTPKIVTQASIK